MNKHKVPMCNNGGANSVAVSEHAMLLMLSVSRRLITQHTNVTAGRWHGNSPPTVHEVRNKVLGNRGPGTIGKKVARLAAAAFGMTVHYYDIARLKEEEEDALGVRFRLLPEILRGSDILSLHVAAEQQHASPDRRGRSLAMMKPSAIIVNTSARSRDRREGDDRPPSPPTSCSARVSTCSTRSRRRPTIPCSARQRHPDGASRRADLGEQHYSPAQRLRQRPARGARRGPAVGRARDES